MSLGRGAFSSPLSRVKEGTAVRDALRIKEEKIRERKLISPAQRTVGLALIVLGALIALVGVFGYLAGDWQIAPLAGMADQVFIAREVALSAGTEICETLFSYFTLIFVRKCCVRRTMSSARSARRGNTIGNTERR